MLMVVCPKLKFQESYFCFVFLFVFFFAVKTLKRSHEKMCYGTGSSGHVCHSAFTFWTNSHMPNPGSSNFRIDMSEQTVPTQIRLFLEEQSDQGLPRGPNC